MCPMCIVLFSQSLKGVYNKTEGRLDNNTPPKRLSTSARSLDKFACVAHATHCLATIRQISKQRRSLSCICWSPQQHGGTNSKYEEERRREETNTTHKRRWKPQHYPEVARNASTTHKGRRTAAPFSLHFIFHG